MVVVTLVIVCDNFVLSVAVLLRYMAITVAKSLDFIASSGSFNTKTVCQTQMGEIRVVL